MGSKYLIQEVPNKVDVFVGDLDEDGTGFMEEVAGEQEAVAEIRQIGVDAEFPSVAESSNHLRLLSQVFVLITRVKRFLIDEGLEIGAVANAVGRVDVDHLDLAGHAFFFRAANS